MVMTAMLVRQLLVALPFVLPKEQRQEATVVLPLS